MKRIKAEYREYIEKALPAELAAGLVDCIEQSEPSVSVRLNPLKAAEPADAEVLRGGAEQRVVWWEKGVYLPERPDFTHDPAMHQGLYYVQDASSMILAHIAAYIGRANHNYPLLYLDACAAPGGKTTAAIDALPEGSVVVANEFDFKRAEVLRENVMKWGSPNVAVTRGDTSRFKQLQWLFDIVAADVPCSGEGMMRKDPKACEQWSRRLVEECTLRQRQIVDNLWETLSPGGYFVYSTCTFNPEENERMVDYIVETHGAEPFTIPMQQHWGIHRDERGAMRFLPTLTRGEGLFVAVLRKPGMLIHKLNEAIHIKKEKGGRTATSVPREVEAKCSQWLEGKFELTMRGDTVYARPKSQSWLYNRLHSELNVLHGGVEVATVKGKTVMPSQGLALSCALRADAFPRVEVDLPTALAYLRRESLPGFNAPNGPVLLCYGERSCPLGFVNNLGNRANNLYPAAWRILH